MIRALGTLALLLLAAAAPEPDARDIVARAYAGAGGDHWANVKSLELTGRAVFYAPDAAASKSVANDYRMWRIFEADRVSAHGEAGLVRIDARADGKLLFQAASDGQTTWTQAGPVPQTQADAFWASNFGFGVIRHALKPGFVLTRLPDDSVDGHPVWMVRVVDPGGTATLFGIDQVSNTIRMVGFATPKGWHVRHYDDFVRRPGWTQARHVTLYYNGVKQNEVFWTRWRIDPPLDRKIFDPANAGK